MAGEGDEAGRKEAQAVEMTRKIKMIAEDMGLAFIHGTTEQLGVLVDTASSPLMALVDYDSSDELVHGCERVETASLSVFFLERVSPSFSPDETVAVYERCKRMADGFIDKAGGNDDARFSTLGITGTVTYRRVNLRYKGMYGGIMITAKVMDLKGAAFAFNWNEGDNDES